MMSQNLDDKPRVYFGQLQGLSHVVKQESPKKRRIGKQIDPYTGFSKVYPDSNMLVTKQLTIYDILKHKQKIRKEYEEA